MVDKKVKGFIAASTVLRLVLISVWFFSFLLCLRTALAEPTARLVINGNPIQTDVPPQIIGGRTMVPVRVVSENLGLSVAWEPRDSSVTVSGGNKLVVLRIGHSRALVDGREAYLDVPPVIRSGRTLVPLRFVASVFGAEVGWDDRTRTASVRLSQVIDVNWTKRADGYALVVRTTAPAGYSTKELTGEGGTPSLLLELSPAMLAVSPGEISVGEAGVVRAAISSSGTTPGSVRVSLELEERLPYKLMASSDGREIAVLIKRRLTEARYQKGSEGHQFVLRANGPFEYEISRLGNPDRIVIDLKGLTLGESVPKEVQLGGLAESARIAQFRLDPDVVRVVVNMRDKAGYRLNSVGDEITLTFSSEIREVSWKEMAGRVRVSVTADRPLAFNVFDLKEPTRLVIDIPDAFFPKGRLEREVDSRDGPVRKIVVAQNNRDPDIVRVVLHLRYYAGYHVVKSGDETGLTIDVLTASLGGKRIVIDPGHGGTDPGAIGHSGVFEKDLNLQIAAAVRQRLSQSGAEVIMTRYDDRDVALVDRPALANKSGADAFVSIHCNSFKDSSKGGTETFYFSNHPDSAYLANLIYEELVSTGLQGRGVRSERFVVLREAAVPAALAEVAFISNPEEERLLKDPAFREGVAEAMTRALSRFFESRPPGVSASVE